ncbi:MAG: oligosaccharide flippase family protein [Candidatus Dormibacteraeota bacterium]|nr:oligosaccharide flippase family protein [Candidatus Dormibacteraeota bacterium]
MSRVGRNIIYNFVGQGLLLLLGLVAVRVVFRQLGGDALGIIYAAATVSAVLSGVLELGVSATIVREVAGNIDNDLGYVRRLIRTGALLYWVAFVLVALLIFFGAPLFVHRWIHLQSMDPNTAIGALRILAISAMVILPRALYTSVLRGLQRMVFNNVIDVSVGGLQQLGTIVILSRGGGVIEVAYWFAACYAAGIIAYLGLTARFFSWRALLPGYWGDVVTRNRRFFSHLMSISLLSAIYTQADKVFVSKFLPLGTFGYYAFASGVVSRATLVTSAIAQAAFPSFSMLTAQGDRQTLHVQYRKLHDLLTFVTVPIFTGIAFAELPLFSYLFNASIAHLLLLPTALLCLGWYMNGTLNVPYVFSLAAGKPEISSRSNFLALFIVLPITGVLVWTLGLNGAALSWVVYHVWAYSYAIRRICRECLEMAPATWYAHIARIGALVAVTYGAAFLLDRLLVPDSVVGMAVAYLLATVAFAIGGYLLIGDELRASLARLRHSNVPSPLAGEG